MCGGKKMKQKFTAIELTDGSTYYTKDSLGLMKAQFLQGKTIQSDFYRTVWFWTENKPSKMMINPKYVVAISEVKTSDD